MPLVEMNWHPTKQECRRFGVAALVMSTLVAMALMGWRDLSLTWALALFGAGAVIFALGLVSDRLIRPVFVVLTLITLPIGLALSFIVMAVFYYGVLTPVGLVCRLVGRDPLRRKWERDAKTYWTAHRPAERAGRYFNQF